MFVKKSENTYKVYEQGNAIRKTVSYGDYWISSSDFNRLSGFSVKPGDVIISCSGTIGEIFIIPEGSPPGIINQALLKITVNETIMDIDYFKLLFQSLVAILKENSIGSAIKNLASVTYLKYQIPILLPPLPEQRRIVKKIDSLFRKAELFNFYSNMTLSRFLYR